MPKQSNDRLVADRPWHEYPLGTKAHAFNGGHWERVKMGWKWCSGATFPTTGGDAIGKCIELPMVAEESRAEAN